MSSKWISSHLLYLGNFLSVYLMLNLWCLLQNVTSACPGIKSKFDLRRRHILLTIIIWFHTTKGLENKPKVQSNWIIQKEKHKRKFSATHEKERPSWSELHIQQWRRNSPLKVRDYRKMCCACWVKVLAHISLCKQNYLGHSFHQHILAEVFSIDLNLKCVGCSVGWHNYVTLLSEYEQGLLPESVHGCHNGLNVIFANKWRCFKTSEQQRLWFTEKKMHSYLLNMMIFNTQ